MYARDQVRGDFGHSGADTPYSPSIHAYYCSVHTCPSDRKVLFDMVRSTNVLGSIDIAIKGESLFSIPGIRSPYSVVVLLLAVLPRLRKYSVQNVRIAATATEY